MFTGEYRLSLDEKGRLMIPARLRYELGENLYITRGPDRNLLVYPESEWLKQVDFLESLPDSKALSRHIKRFLYTGMSCSFDNQGRILIPPLLREYSGLNREVVVVGMSKYLEVWSTEQWSEIVNQIFPRVPLYIEELENGK
ncbi:MAG: Transcriptional regulator MraZ [candidate division WS2 bacterium]|uniref:Transcriptional regulator MraZ n=1 Tax=Psychracetigena formicireducens TaxID=2986056 RepID=A0A9E2F6R6_PSYF1|nr:Transcriptional regulator MraZ [Candidatus Psychracetigena formicireducens]MBT9144853.1 Transcriptional regulator MraZ [Candidatus Psychracetigena formicireducens]